MIPTLLRAVCVFALCSALVSAQAEEKPRKHGKIFKSEVDQLVHVIARHSAMTDRAAPYSDSVLCSAKILTALGHCHRFYVAIDNPRIRATLQQLIRSRAADGSFSTGGATDAAARARATAWTVDALQVMDAERFQDEIATANEWLARHNATQSPWSAQVQGVLEHSRTGEWPQAVGAQPAAAAAAWIQGKDFDEPAVVDALVELVACQTANRALDQGDGPGPVAFDESQQRGIDFLMSRQKDGVFMAVFEGQSFPDPAITGFGILALQTKPESLRTEAEQTAIDQGIEWLLNAQNEDGSYGRQVQNYTTSVVVGALSRSKDPRTKPVLAKAQKYIVMCQNAEQGGYERSDRDYGSIGYSSGSNLRGDLSNLSFAIQALRESGMRADDEALQKSLVFLQRTQNLKSVNDFAGKVSDPDQQGRIIEVTSGDDGGAAYYPGNSAAGYIVQPDGKSNPRSYGSMTYALLKSYTFCGIDGSDPRVQAVVRWIENNWSLAENPGFDPRMGEAARYQGLFYYYMVLAQALDMVGVEKIKTADDPDGISWRKALRDRLEELQLPNGAWLNDKNSRWMEGYDVLCTCYALVALERCR
ncbi:MAG: prenyltransferase/squalene oxidase repeat-containing protein [Planctomycetota bacterium]|nr:prenyltransferase/squalene oxidase repeat-containing protein [Planctomycetota bacterium]